MRHADRARGDRASLVIPQLDGFFVDAAKDATGQQQR